MENKMKSELYLIIDENANAVITEDLEKATEWAESGMYNTIRVSDLHFYNFDCVWEAIPKDTDDI